MTWEDKLEELRHEVARSVGAEVVPVPEGLRFEGCGLGDVLAWTDWFKEADYPNTLVKARELVGQLVHMYQGRWGFGLQLKLLEVPEGDPRSVGEVIFRWGDTVKYAGFRRL